LLTQSLRFSRKVGALLLDRRDREARVRHKLETWADRFTPAGVLPSVGSASELGSLAGQFIDADTPSDDSLTSALERRLDECRRQLSTGPFPVDGLHNGTVTLGRLCYFLCRHLQPLRIVETGVAYGVTTTFILQALADNDRGELISIDLPPLASNAESFVGSFVPQELRSRWKLRLGPAKRLLPDVLREAGTIDLFVHDSLHTYSHMKWEFETALRGLRPGGVIIADDIEGNRAFQEITMHPSVASWFAIRQEGKDAICGAVRKKL
jgi:predicted O-methyltransferase YrrM